MNARRKVRMQVLGIAFLAVLAVFIVYPSGTRFFDPVYRTLSVLEVQLGLDLQGGVHLEYEVLLEKERS